MVYILQFCGTYNCESIHVMRDTTFYLLTRNSCMNPFVYALRNKHYRQAFIELWRKTQLLSLRGNNTDAIKNASPYS